jgi:signal peptidase I
MPVWLEIPLYLAITLVITSLIKTLVVQMYSIPSESMEPTTYKGDRVIVDQFSRWFGGDPARDQVVVFHDPHHWLPSTGAKSAGFSLGGGIQSALAFVGVLPDQKDDLLIKRIIGVAGDTVECKAQDSPVYLNGVPLTENYILNHQTPCFNGAYKVTVPKGQLWVLGDNRVHTGDSSWNYLHQGPDRGFVPTGNVVGHVVGVVSWLREKPAPGPVCPTGTVCGPQSGLYPGVVTSTVPGVPAP